MTNTDKTEKQFEDWEPVFQSVMEYIKRRYKVSDELSDILSDALSAHLSTAFHEALRHGEQRGREKEREELREKVEEMIKMIGQTDNLYTKQLNAPGYVLSAIGWLQKVLYLLTTPAESGEGKCSGDCSCGSTSGCENCRSQSDSTDKTELTPEEEKQFHEKVMQPQHLTTPESGEQEEPDHSTQNVSDCPTCMGKTEQEETGESDDYRRGNSLRRNEQEKETNSDEPKICKHGYLVLSVKKCPECAGVNPNAM